MKNKILIGNLLLCSLFYNGQEVVDTINYKIPYLGKEGGQHIINMILDQDKNDIIINVYSNVKGGQLIANPEEIAKQKIEHNEKGFFGKMLSSLGQSNSYQYVVLPIAQENKININTKKKSVKEEIFYTVDGVPNDNKVYYVPSSGIIDLGFRFNEGDILKHRYTDINKVFTTFPTLDSSLLKFGNIEFKGEGLLGLKNLKPTIIKKEAKFEYDSTKGFVTSPISTVEGNSLELLGDAKATYLDDSKEIYKSKLYSWYYNEESQDYKLLIYDIDNASKKIETFNFENSRIPKILNKSVYDKTNKRVGFLSIFGFDKKQSKNNKIYSEQQFNFIFIDLDGNILFNKIIDYGDGKAYKNILKPTYIVKKDNGKINFTNINMQSLLKGNFELCELDLENSKLTSTNQQNFILKLGDKFINVSDCFENYDEVIKLEKGYIFVKAMKEKDLNSNIEKIKGFNIVKTDDNFNLLEIFKSRETFPRSETLPINFYVIEQKENELVLLDRQGSYAGITKISDGKDTKRALIKTPYMNFASLENYYGYFNQKPFLVDSKNRFLYLIDQFYIKVDVTINLIDKIGITKVSY